MLETGAVGTVAEIAAKEKINPSYVNRVLRLTLLAPAIVETIPDGRQSDDVTLPVLIRAFPAEWDRQLLPQHVAELVAVRQPRPERPAAWRDAMVIAAKLRYDRVLNGTHPFNGGSGPVSSTVAADVVFGF